jgi:hypothetical protein
MPAGHRAPTHPRLAAVVRPAMFLGCTRAMELVLSRVWPARRGRSVLLPDLPTIKSAADLAAAVGTIVQAVAIGRLTPDEGHALGAWWTTRGAALSLSRSKRAWLLWRRKAVVERTD